MALLLALCGCDYILEPDPQSSRDWHSAQWTALAAAWQSGQDSYTPPGEPPRPWGLGSAIPAAYQSVLACRAGEAQAWQELETGSREQLAYCTDLLAALYARDAAVIEQLSTEWEQRRGKQREALEDYAAARRRTAGAVEALGAAWTERWPEQNLDLDLAAALAAAQAQAATPDSARIEQLRDYHARNYARLTRRYLGWADSTRATQQAADSTAANTSTEPLTAPGSSGELRSALQALETALLARNAIETQVAADAGVLQRYAPTSASAARHPAETNRYREPRLAVAQARLALFSRIDALLSPVEDVLQTRVTREWQALWPGCDIETNVYAWAGLPERAAAEQSSTIPVTSR